jgi:hypothetical protein
VSQEIEGLCPHGRHEGAVCVPCAEQDAETTKVTITSRQPSFESGRASGMDAKYYDIPQFIKCAQDLIEWLNLDFASGNILKSLIRENNPDVQKETDTLYEAEKRYYFSKRHLERVRNL